MAKKAELNMNIEEKSTNQSISSDAVTPDILLKKNSSKMPTKLDKVIPNENLKRRKQDLESVNENNETFIEETQKII